MTVEELFALATERYNAGDLPGALDALIQADRCENVSGELSQHIVHGIATVYGELGNADKAVYWWEEFFHPLESTAAVSPLKVAIGYFNYGYNLRRLERYDDAMQKYLAALPVFVEHGMYVARCLQNMAWALCCMGRYDEAEQTLGEAEKHLSTDEYRLHQDIGLAYVYADTERADAARTLCERIIASTENNSLLEQAQMILGIVNKAG